MACDVSSDPVWWPNGAVGREIRCDTCSRVLWQSGPDRPYDASDEFVASVAAEHRAAMKKAEPEGNPTAEPENTEPENTDDSDGIWMKTEKTGQ